MVGYIVSLVTRRVVISASNITVVTIDGHGFDNLSPRLPDW